MSPEAERRPNENEGAAPKSSATTTVTSLQPAAEVVATSTLTEAEAARLTTKIQLRLDTIANNTELVIPMIEAAKNGNAHTALGYRSWTEYVAHRFGGALARLGKGDRLPFVELMADQGLSTRAIASVVGTSHQTVANDLAGAPVKNLTPRRAAEVLRLRPDEIDGLISSGVVDDLDDLERCMKMGEASDQDFEQALTEARRDDDLSYENVAKKIEKILEKSITGVDGKLYTRPAPAETKMIPKNVTGIDGKPTRRSIIKIANLRAIVGRLSGHQIAYAGITAVDPKLTSEEATCLTSDLSKSIAALQGLNRLIKEVATQPGDVQ